MNRALAVSRMTLVDRITLFTVPAAVLGAASLITLAVFALVPMDGRTSGSPTSIYVVVLIAGANAVSQNMSLALGLGASRKAFTIGNVLSGGALAVILGTVMLVLTGWRS